MVVGAIALAAVVGVIALAPRVAGRLQGTPSASSAMIATVNGDSIDQDAFDAYAAVFEMEDGTLRITREQVLESLINQALTAQEAARRQIVVDEAEVDGALAAAANLKVDAGRIEGGPEAFRKRMRAKLLMDHVKSVVAAVPTVDEADIRAAYEADPALSGVSYEEAKPKLAEAIHHAAVEARWSAWLRDMQQCSTIVVMDTSFSLSFDRTRASCP